MPDGGNRSARACPLAPPRRASYASPMPRRLSTLKPLKGDQLRASDPSAHAALSASAGTGKTHVLTARVLRLLLAGVDPSAILCLTFTKAGAAEMAERIHARLAYWVRLKDPALAADLHALGEDVGPDARARARTLFARVLDAPGGGLRIQTIHAFAQSLLGAFPAEAGLVPGFRPLEGREQQQLFRATLAEALVRAEAEGDAGLVADMQRLSHRLGEGGGESFLAAAARAPDALEEIGPRQGIEPRLRRAFDLPANDVEEAIASACADEAFDMAALDRIAAANAAWGTPTGLKCADAVAAWRAGDGAARAAGIGDLLALFVTGKGEPRKVQPRLLAAEPDYAGLAARLAECCGRLTAMRRTAALVADFAAALRAGQTFARAYADAKRAAGLADFDDLIRWTERLLLTPGIGEWVRYKLDQRTDHILVDEAQDTNQRQWNIVRALALEYFAGRGAGPGHRTVFTVGDYKQAIFGFQGTDPDSFDIARAWFGREADAGDRPFLDLSMDLSFRSAPPVLAAVDAVIATLGHRALGLPRPPNPHASHHRERPGSVTLWRPFTGEVAGEDAGDNGGEEGWVSDVTRNYARKLARQIRAWLDAPFAVGPERRPLRPEDILVLVRRRGDLAPLLVARLHEEKVPVAGVDRLLLSAPLAVQDLLAAARFALQPHDDLNLASLLVSPLFGWSQERLFDAAHGREGPLHPRVRDADPETAEGLRGLLDMADYESPYGFFEAILSGPLDGRRRLYARLGPEARDPVEELLSSALDFEADGAPSLQGFLDWFARGEVEVVRDPSAPRDAVRVMTVHGAKGLQAPVVILADACADPDRARGESLSLALAGMENVVPLFRPRKEELAGPLAEAAARRAAADREEHWRLLYVALTRAEERLYIGGALGPADRGGPPEASWHGAVQQALGLLEASPLEDGLWGAALRHGDPPLRPIAARAREAPPRAPAPPDWLRAPAPVEARPPRPLAPSAPDEDDQPYPPPSPDMRAAAERGRLLHALFERLPAVPPDERAARADRWLASACGVDDPAAREALIAEALAIISAPAHAALFGPAALAEAPIAAILPGGRVVAGTVDRLLVAPDRLLVADFKTGRRAPPTPAGIPPAHLRQMAAYAAALRVIFPGRAVEAVLLYTAAPLLHALPDALLAAHAPEGG